MGSPDFEEFLDFLGTKIELSNWNGFRGGLDLQRMELIYFLNSVQEMETIHL
jgi:hypothetical protein